MRTINEPHNHIREWRLKRNMTLSDLSYLSGVHMSTLSQLETTGRQPSVLNCERISEALNVTPSQVRGYDHPYNSPMLLSPYYSGPYLCAYRALPRMPYTYNVLNYDAKSKVWSLQGTDTAVINKALIKWWADIPPAPEEK